MAVEILRVGNIPYRQIIPSKKASSAGWIAKRKDSNTDDANKPYPFSLYEDL